MNLKATFIPQWYDVDVQNNLNRLKKDLKRKQNNKVAPWARKYLEIFP